MISSTLIHASVYGIQPARNLSPRVIAAGRAGNPRSNVNITDAWVRLPDWFSRAHALKRSARDRGEKAGVPADYVHPGTSLRNRQGLF